MSETTTNIANTCIMCSNSTKTSEVRQYPKYCGNHQRDAWINDMMSQGKKVCAGNIRGCRNTMDLSYEYANCAECKSKNDSKEAKRDPRPNRKPKVVTVTPEDVAVTNDIPVVKKTQNVKSRLICAGFEKDENRTKCTSEVELKPNAKFCSRHRRLEMFTPEELQDIGNKGGIIKQCSYKACSNYHKEAGRTCDVCLAKGERREERKKLNKGN